MFEECRTKLLDDSPAPNDKFGSHARVANAIADLILSEDGGKCIGIEGNWGSGKSTVIKLLSKNLNDSEAKIIIIDAWAHEGDPLRRTILERLIEGLQDWMNKERAIYWEQKKKELACRIHKSTKKSNPIFSKWTLAVTFCLVLLFPIGIPFLNAGLRDGITIWHRGLPIAWEFMLGLALVLSPIYPVITRFIYSKINRNIICTDEDKLIYWSFFPQKYSTVDEDTTVENPNPTSVEFCEIYSHLMLEILKDEKRRVVIVLDNLDRIAEKDAIAIWSTLRTFLEIREGSSECYSRLWLIIPYDRSGIKRLWNDSEKSVVAQSFVDKTFQVRFEVPPPVLSDWRIYLSEKLIEAMPDHCDEDFQNVVHLYSCYRGTQEPAPTPRAIIHRTFAQQPTA